MQRIIFCLIPVIVIFSCKAATVDTVMIYSNSMKKSFKCVVIKPDSYKPGKNFFPVVYLLHGGAGDFSNWVVRIPAIKKYADKYVLILVCPDEDHSFYLDSPVDSTMRFETYISADVPAYIDSHYSTIKTRTGRAVTGYSMGGHGALFISFRHADFFGACGSMGGLVNLYASRSKSELTKRIGDTISNTQNWKNYSAVNFIEYYPKDSLAIIIDCGVEDFNYEDNKRLHQKMLDLKIRHEYIERPGQHDWNYCENAIEYQLLFFKKYFDKMKI